MEPSLYVYWVGEPNNEHRGPFEAGGTVTPPLDQDHDSDLMLYVGQLAESSKSRVRSVVGTTASVLQDIPEPEEGRVFCPSEWVKFPPDKLWDEVAPRFADDGRVWNSILLLSVTPENMEWTGTTFEQRYLYFLDGRKCPILKKLAEEEALRWGPHEEFISFKESNPDGYQGVLGDFGFLTEPDPPSNTIYTDSMIDTDGQINVYDAYIDLIHILKVG